MNEKEAVKLAKSALSHQIEIDISPEPSEVPIGIYGYYPEKEYLFTYRLGNVMKVGGDNYIAVSKSTGEVRFLGSYGE